MKIKFLGDTHGLHIRHRELIRDVDGSIGLGDMGLRSTTYGQFEELPDNHYWIRGNHDALDDCAQFVTCLLSFGTIFNKDVFYVAGAETPVFARDLPEEMYENEQLHPSDLLDATEYFSEVKPRVMATHTAPELVVYDILKAMGQGAFGANRTTSFLQAMFELHQPEYWIFGHFHFYYEKVINGCKFICLPELGKDKCTYTLEI